MLEIRNNLLLVHEDFIGLHETDDASAAGIMEMILLICNLNVNQLRGQWYNGASDVWLTKWGSCSNSEVTT